MSKIYMLSLVCLVSILAIGQAQSTEYKTHKLGGLMLRRTLQSPEYAHSDKLKDITVKGDPQAIRSLVAKYGGVMKYSSGQISSVSIPYKNLIAFSESPAVLQIETSEGFNRGRSFMDTARINNNIDSVLLGYALPQPYKGTGVVVGIIDGGIDIRHMDFRYANGNSRIRYIWDQTDSLHTQPALFPYGSEWDSASINNGTCAHKEPSSDQGHGTNVAGIAAGNGSSVSGPFLSNRYTGTAPEANLVVVGLNNNSTRDYLTTIRESMQYIFTKADELGMPCVINTSVGTYYGPHDGSEAQVKLMESLLDQKKGRVLVASAGNGGAIKHHLSYQVSPTDSLFTWFTYNSATHMVYFDLWADTAQFKTVNFALGCDNSAGVYQNRSPYYNTMAGLLHPAPGGTVFVVDSLYNGLTKLCDYEIDVTSYNGLYHVEFYAIPTATTYLWRLQTIGQGTFDLWASKSLIGTSSIATTYPAGFSSPNYRYGDSLKTVVSAWQCSDKVITVANYYNRAGYRDIDSNYVNLTISPYNTTVGALANSSSLGPTRDGRQKPNIGATGDITISTGDSAHIAVTLGANNRYLVGYGGKHSRNGGTSMASPLAAGVVALYLQAHPNADYNEVMTAIQMTARRDTFTSTVNIPNYRFGWGKINALQALKYPVYGCQDTGSINYNALANIDTGGCIAKVYGCTDTASINYSASANVNNGSCVPKRYGIMDTLCRNYDSTANVSSGVCLGVGIKEVTNNDIMLDVQPNPFGKTTEIYIYTQGSLSGSELRFYDVLGKTIDVIALSDGTKKINYSNSKLAAGVYDLALVKDGNIVTIKKVVVE